MGRTTVVASNLSCISECSPSLYINKFFRASPRLSWILTQVSKHLIPIVVTHKASGRVMDNVPVVPVTNIKDSRYYFDIKKRGPSLGVISPSPRGLLGMQDVAQSRSSEFNSAS